MRTAPPAGAALMSISIRLPKDMEARLKNLSERTGRSRTSYVVAAIYEHLDDLEDLYLAEQRLIENLTGRSQTYPLDDVAQNLGPTRIGFDEAAKNDMATLDSQAVENITGFLRECVASLSDPCSIGEAIGGSRLAYLWKYRVDDYRVISSSNDDGDALCVLVKEMPVNTPIQEGGMTPRDADRAMEGR